MKQLSPFIISDNVTETIEAYQHAFGGEIIKLNEHQGQLLHAELKINEKCIIHISSNYGKPFDNKGVHVVMTFESETEEKNAFEALCNYGEVAMPLEKTFFNSIHGQVVDKIGVKWLFNYFL